METKFKVGDKVKIIKNEANSRNQIGDIGTIDYIGSGDRYCSVRVVGGPSNSINSFFTDLELYKEDSKWGEFKAGDWVEVLDTPTVRRWSGGVKAIGHKFQLSELNILGDPNSFTETPEQKFSVNYCLKDIKLCTPVKKSEVETLDGFTVGETVVIAEFGSGFSVAEKGKTVTIRELGVGKYSRHNAAKIVEKYGNEASGSYDGWVGLNSFKKILPTAMDSTGLEPSVFGYKIGDRLQAIDNGQCTFTKLTSERVMKRGEIGVVTRVNGMDTELLLSDGKYTTRSESVTTRFLKPVDKLETMESTESYQTGDIVVIIENSTGSVNHVGDIGTLRIDEGMIFVTVRGRRDGGTCHIKRDIRKATLPEVELYIAGYNTILPCETIKPAITPPTQPKQGVVGICGTFRTSETLSGVDVEDYYRTVVTKSNAFEGMTVVRGRDWKWGDQDKNSAYGVIISRREFPGNLWMNVRWVGRDGKALLEYSYRAGEENNYDLYIYRGTMLPVDLKFSSPKPSTQPPTPKTIIISDDIKMIPYHEEKLTLLKID